MAGSFGGRGGRPARSGGVGILRAEFCTGGFSEVLEEAARYVGIATDQPVDMVARSAKRAR